MTLWLGTADNELIVPDADDLALLTAVPETVKNKIVVQNELPSTMALVKAEFTKFIHKSGT